MSIMARERARNLLSSQLLRNSGIMVIASIVSQVLGLAATVFGARELNVGTFGILLTSISMATLLLDLWDFGTSTFMSRELAKGNVTANDILRFNIRRLKFAPLIFIPWWMACTFVFKDSPFVVYLLGLYPVVLALSMAASAACRGGGRFGIAAGGTLIERGTLLLVTVIAVVTNRNVATSYGIGLLLGSLFSSGFCFGRLGARHSPATRSPHSLKAIYKKSFHFGLAGLATDLSTLEIPLVAAISGGTIAGQFGAANRISGPLGVPASAISAALFPRVATLELSAASSATKRALMILMPLGALFLGLGISAHLLIDVIFGHQYGIATVISFRLILLATWFGSLNQITYAFLQGAGKQQDAARSLVWTMLAGLAFAVGGALWAGAPGAACGIVLKELVTTAWLGALWRRIVASDSSSSLVEITEHGASTATQTRESASPPL